MCVHLMFVCRLLMHLTLAKYDFPVPGGPYSRMPLQGFLLPIGCKGCGDEGDHKSQISGRLYSIVLASCSALQAQQAQPVSTS